MHTSPGTLADDIGCAFAMIALGAVAYFILAI
jgi:hypothetical protein